MRRADLQNIESALQRVDQLKVRIRAAAIRKKLLSRNAPDTVIGSLAIELTDLELVAMADAAHRRNLEWRARKAAKSAPAA